MSHPPEAPETTEDNFHLIATGANVIQLVRQEFEKSCTDYEQEVRELPLQTIFKRTLTVDESSSGITAHDFLAIVPIKLPEYAYWLAQQPGEVQLNTKFKAHFLEKDTYSYRLTKLCQALACLVFEKEVRKRKSPHNKLNIETKTVQGLVAAALNYLLTNGHIVKGSSQDKDQQSYSEDTIRRYLPADWIETHILKKQKPHQTSQSTKTNKAKPKSTTASVPKAKP